MALADARIGTWPATGTRCSSLPSRPSLTTCTHASSAWFSQATCGKDNAARASHCTRQHVREAMPTLVGFQQWGPMLSDNQSEQKQITAPGRPAGPRWPRLPRTMKPGRPFAPTRPCVPGDPCRPRSPRTLRPLYLPATNIPQLATRTMAWRSDKPEGRGSCEAAWKAVRPGEPADTTPTSST